MSPFGHNTFMDESLGVGSFGFRLLELRTFTQAQKDMTGSKFASTYRRYRDAFEIFIEISEK